MTYSVKEARDLLKQARDIVKIDIQNHGCSSRVYVGSGMVLKVFRKSEHAKDAYKAQAYAASYDAAPKLYGKVKKIVLRTGRIMYGFFCQKVNLNHPYLKVVPLDHLLDLRYQMLALFEDQKGKMNLSFLGDIHWNNVGYDDDMGMVLIDFHANVKRAPNYCSEEKYMANKAELMAFKKEWMNPRA